MYETLLLEEVIQAVDAFLVQEGLSSGTLYAYRHHGFDIFRKHFSNMGKTIYSEYESQNLVLKYRKMLEAGEVSERSFRRIRKIHELMKEFAVTKELHYHDLPFWSVTQPNEQFKELLDSFLAWRISEGYSPLTVRGELSTVRTFLVYAESQGLLSASSLSSEFVENYLFVLQKTCPSGISAPLGTLRSFLRFCYDHRMIEQDLSTVLQVRAAHKEKVKQGFSAEEIQKILDVIDTNTPLGKRNYAMIVLSIHTGLRQIDVLNLKLEDIHWREAEIHVIQHKTNRQLILPLDQKTGDAIADYILNGRPKSESHYVFLRTVAPYINLKIGSCIGSRIVQKYAAMADVTWTNSERKGFHSFRRSLGKEMLEKEIPLHTISEVLGHADCNSTKPYLSIDMEHLRQCALSLDGIACRKEMYM